MAVTPSAEEVTETPTPSNTTPAAPATAVLPEGHVAVSASEHNKLQAENRRLKKADADRTAAAEEAETTRLQDAAKAAGDFDEALRLERERTAKADARANALAINDNLRDAIMSAGYAGEQAAALKGLVNINAITLDANGAPAPGAVEAAVEAITTQYPAMFAKEAAPVTPAGEATAVPEARRAVAPATPVGDGNAQGGYISQEEYVNTPSAVRLTPEFQKRVEDSKHRWPATVPANSFPVG